MIVHQFTEQEFLRFIRRVVYATVRQVVRDAGKENIIKDIDEDSIVTECYDLEDQ